MKLTKEKLQEWVDQGLSTKEIAEKTGIKEKSVHQYAWKYGIKMPRSRVKTADAPEEKRPQPEPVQNYGKDLAGETGYFTAATGADQPEKETEVQEEIKEEMNRRLQMLPDKPAPDVVSHLSHYTDGKIEVIDFIEDKKLNFHRGNVVKYVSRAGKKNKEKEIEDLRKAQWYLGREIRRMEIEDGAGIEPC